MPEPPAGLYLTVTEPYSVASSGIGESSANAGDDAPRVGTEVRVMVIKPSRMVVEVENSVISPIAS